MKFADSNLIRQSRTKRYIFSQPPVNPRYQISIYPEYRQILLLLGTSYGSQNGVANTMLFASDSMYPIMRRRLGSGICCSMFTTINLYRF